MVGGIHAFDVVVFCMVVLSTEQANGGASLHFTVGGLMSKGMAPCALLDEQWHNQFLSFGGGPEQGGWVVDKVLDQRTVHVNKSESNERIFFGQAFIMNSPNWRIDNEEAVTDHILLQLL
jgi:hypothetical protein